MNSTMKFKITIEWEIDTTKEPVENNTVESVTDYIQQRLDDGYFFDVEPKITITPA